MYQAIPTNSDLFDPAVVDELNTALSRTNDRIEQFHPKELDYKATLSDYKILGVHCSIQNTSIQIDNEVWITVVLTPNKDMANEVILQLPTVPPAPITSILCHKGEIFDTIPIETKGRDVSIIGEIKAGEEYVLSCYYIST